MSNYYTAGVPHHIGSLLALNYDFRDKSENLRKINHFKKLYKAIVNIFFKKNMVFEEYVRIFGSKAWR